jgi:hypothetical protein
MAGALNPVDDLRQTVQPRGAQDAVEAELF